MPRIKYTEKDVDLLARAIRAEAEGEGHRGMLAVGAVIVNRAAVKCSDFKDVNTVRQVVYQYHNGDASFDCVEEGYFYQRARAQEKRLAKKCLDYWREYPAKYSLWYFNPVGETGRPCPPSWYGQPHSGKWKNHCFYEPTGAECEQIYIV